MIDDVIVKRYAMATGRSPEEVRAIIDALKEKKPDRLEEFEKVLGVLAEYGDKIRDPLILPIIRPVLEEQVSRIYDSDEDFIKKLRRAIDEVSARVAAIKALDALLPDKKKEEENEEIKQVMAEIEAIKQEIKELKNGGVSEKALQPLLDEIKRLREDLKNLKSGGGEDEVDRIIEKMKEREEKAKKLLENLGYRVEQGLSPEQVKELAEKYGFKILEAKIPIEQLEKARREMKQEMERVAKEMYEKGREDAKKEIDEKLLERQAQAVENIVNRAVDRLFEQILGPFIRMWVEGQTKPKSSPAPTVGSGHAGNRKVEQNLPQNVRGSGKWSNIGSLQMPWPEGGRAPNPEGSPRPPIDPIRPKEETGLRGAGSNAGGDRETGGHEGKPSEGGHADTGDGQNDSEQVPGGDGKGEGNRGVALQKAERKASRNSEDSR